MTTAERPTVARVEVLRAEVRVLMVGSRQVTMSVFNQLDEVSWRDIEPMGRVSAKDGPALIGVDAGGVLVRSRFPVGGYRTAALCKQYEHGMVDVSRAHDVGRPVYSGPTYWRYENKRVWVGEMTTYCPRGTTRYTTGEVVPPDPDVVAIHRAVYHPDLDELAAELEEQRLVNVRKAELEALPLIVLAGLR